MSPRRLVHCLLNLAMPPDAQLPGSRLITFRNAFLSGVLLLVPLIATIWLVRWVVDLLGGTFRPLYEDYLPATLQRVPFFWDLIATGIVILIITGLGYLSNYVFGKYFLSVGERFIQRIPGVGAVYNSVKQIVATFGTQNRNLFNKVVMVEFPRKGMWVVGFLTNKQQAEPQSAAGAELWSVFVPTSPNPTSGFLLLLPSHEIIELEMSVADGMKMIISGGAVVPSWPHSLSKPTATSS